MATRLKYLANMRSGEAITSQDIHEEGRYPVYGGNGLRGFTDRYTHRGTHLLIGRQGALCGNVHRVDGEFWASEHALVTTPTRYADPGWLYYMLCHMDLNQYSISAAQPGLSVERIRELTVLTPYLAAQRAIADFLDRKTAAIDVLIEKKERLIALLAEKRAALIHQAVTKGLDPKVPMKDSGVPWIGQIPAHWAVRPLYASYSVQLGKMLNAAAQTGTMTAPYLRNADIQWDRINIEGLHEMDFDPADRRKYRLRKGDILMCEGGANARVVGKSAIWEGALAQCYYQKALHRIRAEGKHEQPRFLLYALWAAFNAGVFVADANANIYHLTAEKLRVMRFVFPDPSRPGKFALDKHR